MCGAGCVDRETKEAILGMESLSEREKQQPPKDRVVLFHWEKTVHTWMDIFDHFGLTSLATCTVGRCQMESSASNSKPMRVALRGALR